MIFDLKKKILNNVSISTIKQSSDVFIGESTATLFGVLTSIVVARILSVNDRGVYLLILAYVDLFSIFSLPGMNFVIKKGVMKGCDRIYLLAIKRALIIAVVIGIALIIVSLSFDFIIQYFDPFSEYMSQIKAEYFLISGIFICISPFNKYDYFLNGKALFSLLKKLKVVLSLVSFIIIITAAVITKSCLIIAIMALIARLIHMIVGNYYVIKNYNTGDRNVVFERQLIAEGWKYSIVQATTALSVFGRVFIGTIDPIILSVFEIGNKFAELVKERAKNFIVAPLINWGKLSREKHLMKMRQKWPLLLGLGVGVGVLVAILSPLLITVFYGEKYQQSITIAYYLSIPMIVIFLNTMVHDYDIIQANGYWYRKLQLLNPFVYIISLYLLMPKYQLMGIVYSLFISHIFRSLISICILVNIKLCQNRGVFYGNNC